MAMTPRAPMYRKRPERPFYVVYGGVSSSVIALADSPSSVADDAADLLIDWVNRCTGVTLTKKGESTLNAGELAGNLILVGDSSLASGLGYTSSALSQEEAIIASSNNRLVLIGSEETALGVTTYGTLFAVLEFVERFLGCRMFWPGAVGYYAPTLTTIQIQDHYRWSHVPPLRMRRIREIGYNDRVQDGLDILGWTKPDFDAHIADGTEWFTFHRIATADIIGYGHAYSTYHGTYGGSHPEWFALQYTNDRTVVADDRARLCKSNSALVAQIATNVIALLTANPTYQTVSISPNDGGAYDGFCLCENCEAMDDPGGENLATFWIRTEAGYDYIEHVALSDRVVAFYNAIAAIVKVAHPGRGLGCYAYSLYRNAPISQILDPYCVLAYVPVPYEYLNDDSASDESSNLLAWMARSSRFLVRPNSIIACYGYVTNIAKKLEENVKIYVNGGTLALDWDGFLQSYGSEGFSAYVLAKLMWDPTLSASDIIEDYCDAAFGAGSTDMQLFFDLIETTSLAIAAANGFTDRASIPGNVAPFFDAAWKTAADGHLDDATAAAAGDAGSLARIQFYRDLVEYVRLRAIWDTSTGAAKVTASANLQAKIQAMGLCWQVNHPYMSYYFSGL